MSGDLLTVETLAAGYGPVPVLHDVDLRVPTGTIAAVIGANGATLPTLQLVVVGEVSGVGGEIAWQFRRSS